MKKRTIKPINLVVLLYKSILTQNDGRIVAERRQDRTFVLYYDSSVARLGKTRLRHSLGVPAPKKTDLNGGINNVREKICRNTR